MARPIKTGLDYFELDCQLEEKIRLIQAEFGLKGFAIVVKLYQKIYGGFGYYCEWNDDSLLLFMSENGVSSRDEKNLMQEIVSACIRRNIFSEKLLNEFGILTSLGVQKRYLNATSRREKVELIKEYLLLDVPKNQVNVVINSINVNRNSVNVNRNTQSREEKSRAKNINTMCKAEALALFEHLWKIYPVKRGKGQVSDSKKMELLKVGSDEMERAISRYKAYVDSVDYLHYQNGSTFFNSGYVDYLDANYDTSRTDAKPKKSNLDIKFNNFEQRDYDFDELERRMNGG